MKLFTPAGCLSDEALHALLNGRLEASQRLAAAEHLSHCDSCLLRHLDMQEAVPSDALPLPPAGLETRIFAAVRRTRLRLFVKHCAPVAAAACFALAFTFTGLFGKLPDMSPAGIEGFRTERDIVSAVSQTAAQYKDTAGPLLESLFRLDFLKGDSQS